MLSSVVSLLALAKPYGSDAQVRAICLSICSLKGRSLEVKTADQFTVCLSHRRQVGLHFVMVKTS